MPFPEPQEADPKSPTRPFRRRALATLAVLLGIGLLGGSGAWQDPAETGGARVFLLQWFTAQWELPPERVLEIARWSEGQGRALAAILALALGLAAARWARRSLRVEGHWLIPALAFAFFLALDPGLFAFLAQRSPDNGPNYLDLSHALSGAGISLIALGLLGLLPKRVEPARPDSQALPAAKPRPWARPLELLLAGALLAGTAQWEHAEVLRGRSLTNDGVAYRFQSRLFAEGKTHLDRTGLEVFFPARQIWPGSGEVPRVFAKYPPGHGLTLAFGRLLGFDRLFVLLGALLLPALVYALARELSAPGARLGAWFTALSPALLGVFATQLAFGTTVPAAALLLWATVRGARLCAAGQNGLPMALTAGAALGWISLARPGTAVALGAWALLFCLGWGKGRLLRLLPFAALAALPFAAALLLFQAATTGDPLASGYTLYAKSFSPDDTWGLANLPRAFDVTLFNGARLSTWLVGLGGGLAAVVLGIAFLAPRARFAVVFPAVCLAAFYALLTFHGVPWAGPVYLLEGVGPLCIALAGGVHALGSGLHRAAPKVALVAALGASTVVLWRQMDRAAAVVEAKHGPRLQAAEQGIEQGLILVPLPDPKAVRRVPLPPPTETDDLWFARDLGPGNAALAEQFEEDEVWIFEPSTGELRPYDP